MEYRDQPFSQRLGTLGDTAEGVYFSVAPLGSTTRFGFRRPKGIRFSDIPANFRHMPDAITSTHLVEVMGLGRDGILKSVKTTKYEAIKFWQKTAVAGGLMGVALFVWNSSKKTYVVFDYPDLVKEVSYSKRTDGVQAFPNDGNEYYPIRWDRLVASAIKVGEHNE